MQHTANCAVCGGPGEPECPCEGTRLQQCINQAENKWMESWMTKTREWVTNKAIETITTTFERKKEARKEMYKQQVMNIPYFPIYQQHRGRPPLDPRLIMDIQRNLHAAEIRLKQGIDQDWKSCVVRYPEVLAHFYSQVHMQIPSNPPPFGQALAGGGQPRPASVVNPSLPPPPQSVIGMGVPRSTTAPPKKNRERRSSKINLDQDGLDGDVMAMLTQKLQGAALGRSNTGRTKAATPAPQASTPAPRTGRPGTKRRESKDYKNLPQGFMPPPPPPPPPQAPQVPPAYDQQFARLGVLGQFGH